jgi:hypothetical protein
MKNAPLYCVISGFRREANGTALFWVIMQPVVVIPYRRFGETYRFRLQGPRIQKERLSRNVSKELPLLAT